MIRVIIEREIAEGLEKPYEQVVKRSMQQVIKAEGYISGESLIDVKRNNHRFVLVSWQSLTAWQRWHSSSARKALYDELKPMIVGDERISVLGYE